jgi:hypothetical protein
MRSSRIAVTAVAALLTAAPSALAQTSPQSSDAALTQTYSGCLMKETDFRRAHNLGDGQLGGVGLGDEFVLVDVKVSPAKATAAPMTTATTPASAASAASASTTPCADRGVAYRLTGSAEEQLKQLVGRQLDVQGRFKHADDAAAGGTRPDEKLPAEIEIVSFVEAPSAAPMTAPATSTMPPASSTVATSSTATAAASTQTTTPPPVTNPTPATNPTPIAEPRELPRTASSSPLVWLIGVVALSAGLALALVRRRAV